MITRSLNEITVSDINDLISNHVREGKTIDYKRDIALTTDDQKREFCNDVVSLSNTLGGDLVFGIEELAGVPIAAPGFTCANIDIEIQRMNNVLQTSVEPRLPPIDTRAIQLPTGLWILVVRVRQSWSAPHRGTRDARFYGRNSAGKYALDVGEVRRAFLQSEGQADRIKRFREDRLGKIIAKDTPTPLADGGVAVLHSIPLTLAENVDLLASRTQEALSQVRTLGRPTSSSWRRNLDGHLNYAVASSQPSPAYSQLFRNGATEQVAVLFERQGELIIPSTYLEEAFIAGLGKVLRHQREIGVRPPIYVFVSLLSVRNYALGVSDRRRFMQAPEELDRDNLIFPEIIVDDFSQAAHSLLRPTLDLLWQAYGYDGCPNFDAAGNRIDGA